MKWQIRQQDRLSDVDYRGDQPDADCQSSDHGKGKSRRSAESPNRIPEILQCLFEPNPPPLIAALLLHLLHSSKLPPCGVTRLVGVHARGDVSLHLQLHMQPHLLRHLRIKTIPPEPGTEFGIQLHGNAQHVKLISEWRDDLRVVL
jgi:hypothetical protein